MSRADTPHGEGEQHEAGEDLSGLIHAHEDIDWHDVPCVSPAEAAAWTQRLIEARADQDTNVDD